MKKTTILTGFLGAGKTTYLNYLIKKKPNTRFAIIENEYGEQSIDGDLIIRSDDNTVEMNNGCLCCTLNENLYELLNDLYERREKFDELIIEATGVADPAGIAEPFLTHPAIKNAFELQRIICLIDAELIEDQLKDTEEARQQISFSDLLLINKTDLVHSNYVDVLKDLLKNMNPYAEVVVKGNHGYPVESCIGNKIEKSTLIKSDSRHHSPTGDCNHHYDEKSCNHVRIHKHQDIITHSFVFSDPFDIQKLYHHLFVYLTFQAKNIYRVKGIIYSTENNKKKVIQSVGKRLGIEEIGDWEMGELKQSKIVFIGKNIKSDGLKTLLEKCSKKKLNSL
ncbi:MAG: GTP-binding protein [Balneolaceae bacterium]|nr:MAG: GTP-binding protein [Balneolaceae bacterium]